VRVKFYSQSEMAKRHPPGLDMVFGGGAYTMRPEAAEQLAYGLVELDRPTGLYKRVQLSPVEERMLIEQAKSRQRAEAADHEPAHRGNRMRHR
jgi:hypothetical protein